MTQSSETWADTPQRLLGRSGTPASGGRLSVRSPAPRRHKSPTPPGAPRKVHEPRRTLAELNQFHFRARKKLNVGVALAAKDK